MRRLSRLALLLALVPAGATPLLAQAAPTTLTFSTVLDALESTISQRVLTEAYRRIGIDVRVQRFPGDSALQRANSGAVDGDLQRIDFIEVEAPNLVQVPVPIAYLEVGVFSHDPMYRVRSWLDLRDRRVGVVKGILAVQRAMGDVRVREVDSYGELYRAMARGEVDAIVVGTQYLAAVPLLAKDTKPLYLSGVLDTYMLYHHLHRRHAALVTEIEPVLKSMLMDGTIARMRADVIADVMRGGRP